MKKLLGLLLAGTAVATAMTGCGSSTKEHSLISNNGTNIKIGDQEIDKQYVYELLKTESGVAEVTSWFKKSIYAMEEGHNSTELQSAIDARIETIWTEETSYNFHISEDLDLMAMSQGYDNLTEWKAGELKYDAIDQLFTEAYITSSSDIVEDLYEDLMPTQMWTAAYNKAAFAETAMAPFNNETAFDMTDWANAAQYLHYDYVRAAGETDNYDQNTDEQRGVEGQTADTWRDQSPTTIQGSESRVGYAGVQLKDASEFDAKFTDIIFDDELDSNDVSVNVCSTQDFDALLVDEDCILENGLVVIDGFPYDITNTGTRAVRVNILSETNGHDVALRAMANDSGVAIDAIEEFFEEKYQLEVFDPQIYDAISSDWLDNKDD